jgi:hypothetical protein
MRSVDAPTGALAPDALRPAPDAAAQLFSALVVPDAAPAVALRDLDLTGVTPADALVPATTREGYETLAQAPVDVRWTFDPRDGMAAARDPARPLFAPGAGAWWDHGPTPAWAHAGATPCWHDREHAACAVRVTTDAPVYWKRLEAVDRWGGAVALIGGAPAPDAALTFGAEPRSTGAGGLVHVDGVYAAEDGAFVSEGTALRVPLATAPASFAVRLRARLEAGARSTLVWASDAASLAVVDGVFMAAGGRALGRVVHDAWQRLLFVRDASAGLDALYADGWLVGVAAHGAPAAPVAELALARDTLQGRVRLRDVAVFERAVAPEAALPVAPTPAGAAALVLVRDEPAAAGAATPLIGGMRARDAVFDGDGYRLGALGPVALPERFVLVWVATLLQDDVDLVDAGGVRVAVQGGRLALHVGDAAALADDGAALDGPPRVFALRHDGGCARLQADGRDVARVHARAEVRGATLAAMRLHEAWLMLGDDVDGLVAELHHRWAHARAPIVTAARLDDAVLARAAAQPAFLLAATVPRGSAPVTVSLRGEPLVCAVGGRLRLAGVGAQADAVPLAATERFVAWRDAAGALALAVLDDAGQAREEHGGADARAYAGASVATTAPLLDVRLLDAPGADADAARALLRETALEMPVNVLEAAPPAARELRRLVGQAVAPPGCVYTVRVDGRASRVGHVRDLAAHGAAAAVPPVADSYYDLAAGQAVVQSCAFATAETLVLWVALGARVGTLLTHVDAELRFDEADLIFEHGAARRVYHGVLPARDRWCMLAVAGGAVYVDGAPRAPDLEEAIAPRAVAPSQLALGDGFVFQALASYAAVLDALELALMHDRALYTRRVLCDDAGDATRFRGAEHGDQPVLRAGYGPVMYVGGQIDRFDFARDVHAEHTATFASGLGDAHPLLPEPASNRPYALDLGEAVHVARLAVRVTAPVAAGRWSYWTSLNGGTWARATPTHALEDRGHLLVDAVVRQLVLTFEDPEARLVSFRVVAAAPTLRAGTRYEFDERGLATGALDDPSAVRLSPHVTMARLEAGQSVYGLPARDATARVVRVGRGMPLALSSLGAMVHDDEADVDALAHWPLVAQGYDGRVADAARPAQRSDPFAPHAVRWDEARGFHLHASGVLGASPLDASVHDWAVSFWVRDDARGPVVAVDGAFEAELDADDHALVVTRGAARRKYWLQ